MVRAVAGAASTERDRPLAHSVPAGAHAYERQRDARCVGREVDPVGPALAARVPQLLRDAERERRAGSGNGFARRDEQRGGECEAQPGMLEAVGTREPDLPGPYVRRGKGRQRFRGRGLGSRCLGRARGAHAHAHEQCQARSHGGRLKPWALPGSAEHARRTAEAKLRAHPWPPALLDALARLAADGHRALLVGGSVRDVVLGRALDTRWDVASDHPPERVREMFERTEGIGERHGTVLVLHMGLTLECTTFRREGEYADARHPDQVWFTTDPLEDLARRDLTVNAMAFDPARGELLDPFEGARDLARRRLRAVGEPLARFREDALRTLRVARFAAVLEMELDDDTRSALGGVLDRMAGLAPERVREELEKLMVAPRPSVGYEILREAGLLSLWLPELAACRGVPQNRFHAYDVYFHSLYSCDAARPEKPEVRWAALLHDIGKPGTRAEKDGEGTFHGHAELGARLADALLVRLRFSNVVRERIVLLIREHMFDYRPEWTDAAVRRFVRRVGPEHIADLFDLRLADALGNGTRDADPRRLELMARRIDKVIRGATALSIRDLAVDGGTVMRTLGLPSGPGVGRVLEQLLEAVLDDPSLNTRERLLARLEALRDSAGRP